MKHSIEFAITTYCQAKCRACPRTDSHTGEQVNWLTTEHMDIAMFQNNIKSFDEIRLKDINFCGELGDPMMHPDIDMFIYSSLEYAERVTISTNAGLRQPIWYENSAKKYGEKLSMKFAVDGADHETNWHYREGVNFDRAIDNMTAYFANGGVGKWKFLIFDWNYHQIVDAYNLANKIGCDIEYAFNRRPFVNTSGLQGRISNENAHIAKQLLKEIDYEI